MQKLRSIQVLRGLAACAVVVLHARYATGQTMDHSVARLGAAGVDLFFVISGFIMASIAKPSVGRFMADRLWRIFPLWLVAVTPWLLLEHHRWEVVAASLTLWPVYGHFMPPALALGWSLSFELLFYSAIAVALLTRRLIPLALFGAALVAGAFEHRPIFDFIGNPMIFEFLAGTIIARLPRRRAFALPLIVTSAAIFAAAPLSMYPADVAVNAALSGWRAAFWGTPAALLVYGCLSAEEAFASRAVEPFVLLGDASYSIYLFHKVAIRCVALPWVVEFAVAVSFGVIVWRMVERPLLRLRPRLPDHRAVGVIAAG